MKKEARKDALRKISKFSRTPRPGGQISRRRPALLAILLVTLISSVWPAVGRADEPPPTLLLILDASITGQDVADNSPTPDEKTPSVEGAWKTLQPILDRVAAEWPVDTRLGLVAYGHRRAGDCQDVETLLPFAPLDLGELRNALGKLDQAPRGAETGAPISKETAPITRSLEHAFAMVKLDGRPTTVILVTKSTETCGGDPCSVVDTAHSSGMTFLLQVVDFGIEDDDISALRCAAESSGGGYFVALDEAQLEEILAEATAIRPEIPTSGLRVLATADGALIDVTIHVTDPTGGQRGVARTYTDPATNPRFLPLTPGRYQVTVSPLALGPRREQFEFTIEADQILERTFDFSSGELAVGATHNGRLGEAVIRVKNSHGNQVAAGRTRSQEGSNPKRFQLIPGDYAVTLGSLTIANKPEETFDVTVEPGKTTEVTHAFSSGLLEITVRRGEALIDSIVSVHPRGQRREITKKRASTKATRNPVRFMLVPGDYDVKIRLPRGEERRLIEVNVGEAETLAETVIFDAVAADP